MFIQRDLYIEDLHYILEFNHYYFSFHLNHIPKRLSLKSKDRKQLLFHDAFYEDLNIPAPALLVFRDVMKHIDEIVKRYHIQYWEFSASSFRKASIYEKLLNRYIKQQNYVVSYVRDGLHFYVYPVLA